jgi:hypothetical protein
MLEERRRSGLSMEQWFELITKKPLSGVKAIQQGHADPPTCEPSFSAIDRFSADAEIDIKPPIGQQKKSFLDFLHEALPMRRRRAFLVYDLKHQPLGPVILVVGLWDFLILVRWQR